MVLRIRFCLRKNQVADGVPESKQSPTPKRIRFRLGGAEHHAPQSKKIKKKNKTKKQRRQKSMITAADDDKAFLNPTARRPMKLRVVFNRVPVQVQPRHCFAAAEDFGMQSGCSFEEVVPLVPPPPFHLCLLSQGQFSDSVTDVYDSGRLESESVNQEEYWGRTTYRNSYYSDYRRFDCRESEERFNWMVMSTGDYDGEATESVGDNFHL